MNIMLVSVTERTREIGIRKAIGARSGHLTQFLIESVFLTGVGGLLGVLFVGFGIALIVKAATPLRRPSPPGAVVLGLSVSAAIGLFFGIFPPKAAHTPTRSSPSATNRRQDFPGKRTPLNQTPVPQLSGTIITRTGGGG